MSGIEAAGLALGLFPVVIDMLTKYSGLIRSRDVKRLTDSLKIYELIYRNCVEQFLHEVWPEELATLMGSLEDEKWGGETLKEKVAHSSSQETENIVTMIKDIHKTISVLHRKLPERRDDASVVKRATYIIKCFYQGPSCSATLERLRISIGNLQTLTKGTLKLAPLRRNQRVDVQDLSVVKDSANRLYDAIFGGWNCNCANLHPANIRLEVWTPRLEPSTDLLRLYFSFLLSENAQDAEDRHWTTAEVTVSRASFPGNNTIVQSPASGSLGSTLQQNSTTSQSVTSVSQMISLPPTSTTGTSPLGNLDCVEELHRIVNSNGNNFRLFRRTDPVASMTSDTLASFYSQRKTMANRERVQLALMLAWAVLQMSCTSWLRGKWTKENVLLVRDSLDKHHPYITHRFHSARRNSQSSTLCPTSSHKAADWIRNISLFALGVSLLEICFSKSIEELALPEEKQSSGDLGPSTVVLTAARLAKTVQAHLGLHYSQAVYACLNASGFETNQAGEPVDSSEFEKAIRKDIVDPLEFAAGTFSMGLVP